MAQVAQLLVTLTQFFQLVTQVAQLELKMLVVTLISLTGKTELVSQVVVTFVTLPGKTGPVLTGSVTCHKYL